MHVSELPRYDPQRPLQAHDDELCLGLIETDLWTESADGKRTVHRFQIIDFIRDKQLCREVRDLTLEKVVNILDQLLPMKIIAGGEDSTGKDTVARVKYLAEEARERQKARVLEMAQRKAQSTLLADHAEYAELRHKLVNKKTHFGAGKSAGNQRN